MFKEIDDNKMDYSDQYKHLQSSSGKPSRCRVCLEESSDLQNLFSSTKMNYASKIEQCALVDIREDDGLPQNICVDCIQLLESAHKFKTLCEQSNQTLKLEVLNHVEIKIENELLVENHTESLATVKIEPQSNDEIKNIEINNDVNTDQLDDKDESLDDSDWLNPVVVLEEVKVPKAPKKLKKSIQAGEVKTKLPRAKQKRKPKQKLQCDECGYVTVGPTSLEDHKRARHRGILDFYKCEHCPKAFARRSTLQCHFNAVHDINPIVCETCGKTFRNKLLLYNHNATKHLGVKKHRCEYCPFMFKKMSLLLKHQKTHTTIAEEHPCKICNKVYKSQNSLSVHTDRVHKNIRSFKCDECDKSFFTSLTLRQHKLVHSGLKPYICPLCPGTAYTWYSALAGHNKTSHPENKLESESSMYSKILANLKDNRTEQNS